MGGSPVTTEVIKSIVYDTLLMIAAVMLPVVCTCFGALWVICKRMVYTPIDDLSKTVEHFGQRVERFNDKLIGLEAGNNGRLLVLELKTKHLERGQSILFDRCRSLETNQPKEG